EGERADDVRIGGGGGVDDGAGGGVLSNARGGGRGDGRRRGTILAAHRDGDARGGVVDAVIGVDGDLVGVVGVEVGGALIVGRGEKADLASRGVDRDSVGVALGV